MSADRRVSDADGIASFQSPAEEDVVVRATGDQTDGQYDLVEVAIPPGPAVTPLHVHRDNDEAMLVLGGEVTVQLEDDQFDLTAGGFAMAPRGVPHTYGNAGEDTARVLFVYTPGDHWEYLREAGAAGPVEDESDVERLAPILGEYGIELVGPPIGGAAEP